jgi:DNA-directed RNA polymerase subunit beta'
MADIGGRVEVHRDEDGIRTVKLINSRVVRDNYPIKRGWKVVLDEAQEAVKDGDVIATRGDKEIQVKRGGRPIIAEESITIVYDEREEREYEIPSSSRLLVAEGQCIEASQPVTEGSKNPHTILSILGREATQLYLLQEVQKVYRSQGVNIHDKHFEVIVSKMLSRVLVIRSGDTELLPGDLVDRRFFADLNARVVADGGQPASAKPVLLGVTKTALSTDSFLSASSFQHTIKVLAGAAIEGKQDDLKGLKENVIIGKLIPAGTGFWEAHREELLQAPAPKLSLEEGLAAGLPTGIDLELEEIDVAADDLEDALEDEMLDLDELDDSDDPDDDAGSVDDLGFLLGEQGLGE